MVKLLWFREVVDYLAGVTDTPPAGFAFPLDSVAWGLLWGGLPCAIAIFSGQTSKFIYIDF